VLLDHSSYLTISNIGLPRFPVVFSDFTRTLQFDQVHFLSTYCIHYCATCGVAGRRGLLSWLLRGTWQPFEVVLLDHGSYLTISNRLRQQYCQLWCSLFAGDSAGAASVAIELGGQRAGQILPVILTQRGRNK
jgi:hypothetical protein